MVKWLVLRLLAEEERHGYELLRVFPERGWGSPGPGSIYPILIMLESEGYVKSREENGKRVYVITEEGRRYLREGAPPFDEAELRAQYDSFAEVRDAMQKLTGAIAQLEADAGEKTIKRIVAILKQARKEIYTLLAND